MAGTLDAWCRPLEADVATRDGRDTRIDGRNLANVWTAEREMVFDDMMLAVDMGG